MKTSTPNPQKSYRLSLLSLASTLLISSLSFSAVNTISTSGTWENPLNWALGHLPLNSEDVVITGNVTVTINSAVVCGSLTIGDNMGQSPTLTINGSNSLSVSASNGGTGNLIINPSNKNKTYTINIGAGSMSVAGSLLFGSSGTNQIDVANGTLNFSNTNGVTWNDAILSMTGTSNVTFAGIVELNGGTIQNTTTAATLSFNNGLVFNGGTFTSFTGETINFSGDLTANADLTFDPASTSVFKANGSITATEAIVFGNVKINSGVSTTAAGNFSVAGNWTNNGGTFIPGTNTITFDGTANQAINGTATSQIFYNVILALTAGKALSVAGSTTTLTVQDFTEITGNFSAGTATTLHINGNTTITAGTFSSGTNTYMSGNFSNAGTYTASAGNTLTFNGSNAAVVNGSGTYTIKNVGLNKSTKTTAVDIQSANFITGIDAGNVYNFTFTQGTWKYNNTATLTDCHNSGAAGSLTIPFNVIIESDAGTMNLCKSGTMASGTQSNVILSGKLTMNGGTVNVTSATTKTDLQYKVNGGTPQLYISSGILNMNAGFNYNSSTDYIDFNMSGGTVNMALGSTPTNNPTFVVNDVNGGSTNMSAGLIVIQEATNGVFSDIDLGASNLNSYSVTGGTIQFGNASTAANTVFAFQAYPNNTYPNFVLNAGTAKKVQPLNNADFQVMSITINANMTFDIADYLTSATTKNMTINSSDGTNAFYNAGTFTQRNSTVIFSGSVSQNITGTVSTTFDNLTIANTGGCIPLGISTTVTGVLTLTNGLITTTSSDILTLTSTASATSGNAGSFVNGPMIKTGNTAFVFPVGKGTKWARVGISAPATSTNQVTAEYFNTPYTNTTSITSPLTNVSTMEYWVVSESVTANSLKVTLYWENAAASGIETYDNTLRVAHWNGTTWGDMGQNSITASGAGNVTSNTVSNFSPFTFGSTSPSHNPLPIQLLSFTAKVVTQNKVQLNWITATETMNHFFTVERSADGSSWEQVYVMQGAGTTTKQHSYINYDNAPLSGTSFYRLKQTDFDEHFTYSQLQMVNIESPVVNKEINVYPNPANISAGENINVQLSGFEKENAASIELYDLSGRLILSETVNTSVNGDALFTVQNNNSITSGIYLIHVNCNGKIISKKLVIN